MTLSSPHSPPPQPTTETDFSQVLSALRRFALPILGASVLAGTGAYLLADSQPRFYEASSSLIADRGGSGVLSDSVLTPSPLPPGALQQALRSPAVINRIAAQLRAADVPAEDVARINSALYNELKSGSIRKLWVEAGDGSRSEGVFTLHAVANTPELASALANAGVAALQEWDVRRAQRRLELARASLQQQLAALDRAVERGELYDDSASFQVRSQLVRDLALAGAARRGITGTLDVVAEAVPPSAPIAPRPRRTALIAALLALLVASGGAVLLDSLRRRGGRGAEPYSLPSEGQRRHLNREAAGLESRAP
ncbi:hypothetical protein [Deinococcus sp. YIM 77859]|uniref:hypothetical protein n=1 Tax=Deinococcus sp. YIM 77859 TaxID=1540221 RepID=UPI00055363BE|nr:hypothetical protein [Deinococcus sp. YIM 77859]